jgi:predicted dinucleotide-binding enzyme
MSVVSIIGSGNMGQAIGSVVTRGGNTIDPIGHQSTTVTGDIVILAVPYPSLSDIVGRLGDQLAGKIVVDITNPLNFKTFDELVVPADSSSAAELAKLLPNSIVLKAFNTTFAATLATGKVGDSELTTTVLIAGDDAAAKETLAAVVTAGGLNAIDAGSLKRARELEAIGFEQLVLASGEKIGWGSGFAIVK